jgi:hypothetical protein
MLTDVRRSITYRFAQGSPHGFLVILRLTLRTRNGIRFYVHVGISVRVALTTYFQRFLHRLQDNLRQV